MTLFRFPQAFLKNFFPVSRLCIFFMNVALIAGAKVKTLFDSRKFIFRNFYLLSKPAFCQYLLMNFAFIAGAKVAPFSAFANFIVTFFELFLQNSGKQIYASELF